MRLRSLTLSSFFLLAAGVVAQAAAAEPVQLNWLGDAASPAVTGISWGVPWPQGAVPKATAFALRTADGKALPLQSWPLAYWPDGSLKWSGLATVAGPGT